VTVALGDFASSCLGEAVSPERDNSSLKNTTPRLGECSSKKLGEFLLFLPRRDELAWAKISVFTPVHAYMATHQNPQSIQTIFIRIQTSYKYKDHEIAEE